MDVLRGDEWYELIIFKSDGETISPTIRTRATAWRVPLDRLMPAGSGETDRGPRVFFWQVQVVREMQNEIGSATYQATGAPSTVRTFVWLEPTPTPTAITSPTP